MAGHAHPVELIRFNSATRRFEVGEEAIRTLQRHPGPVGVVAVCGRARQGKSYILNQLLGQSSGFQVAATHRPCTKGLWMWSAPIERKALDGSKYHMVLLDTEGIDAYDQTGQYSTQIFSLAVLLSSLFVYNQMGGIDEAALDRLSLVTEMTRHIRVRANTDSSGNEWELGEFTPSFIWLLRDFYLMLEEDGHAVTPRDYLETALRPVSGSGPSVESKNQIRASIKALFPDRECHTLVRPVNDEKALQMLETIDSSELRPEFRKGLAELTRAIFQRGLPKRVGSMVLTGPLLAGLTRTYVDAINNGAVPCISTAWQGVAEAECRRGAEAAEMEYVKVFNTRCGGEVEELDAEHRRSKELANKAYDKIAIGDEKIKEAHRQRWMEVVDSRYENFRDKRIAEGALACEQMLNMAQARLNQMTAARANPEAISEEFAAFMEAYSNSSQAVGPTKYKRLQEFMTGSFKNTLDELARQSKERIAEVEEDKRKAIDYAEESQRRAMAAEQEAEACRAEAGASKAQAEACRSEAQASRAESEAARAQAEQAAREASMAKQKAEESQAESAASKAKAAERQRAAAAAEERARAAEAAAQVSAAEVQSWRSRAESSARDLEAAMAEISQRAKAAQAAVTERESWRIQAEAAARDLEAAMAEISQRAKAAQAAVTERDSWRSQAEAAARDLEAAMAEMAEISQRANAAEAAAQAAVTERDSWRSKAEAAARDLEASWAEAEQTRRRAEAADEAAASSQAKAAEAARAAAEAEEQRMQAAEHAASKAKEAAAAADAAASSRFEAESAKQAEVEAVKRAEKSERLAVDASAKAEEASREARASRQELAIVKAQLQAQQQMNQNASSVYQEQMTQLVSEKESEMRVMRSEMEADIANLRAQVAQFKADLSRAHTVMNEKERRVIEAESKEKVLQEELESVKHTMEMTQAELRQFKERLDVAERERQAAVEARARAEDSAARAQVAAREDAARAARTEAEAKAARSTLTSAANDFNTRLGQWEAPAASRSAVYQRSQSAYYHRSPQEELSSPQRASPHGGSLSMGAGFEAPNMGSPVADAKHMTIPQMKDWLVKHGKEDLVSQLSFQRAKKAEWVETVEQFM